MNRISFSSSYFFPTILKEINQINKIQSRIKPLSNRIQSKGGRLNGTIIAPRRNNYIRRLYRYIDFQRSLNTIHSGIILQKIYDPNRTANLCFICYPSGFFSYILQPSKVAIGDCVTNNAELPINNGDSASLHHIRSGRLIHNIQGKFTRSAGCSTILVRKDYDQALLKLKSGELRFFHTSVVASLGMVGNENYFLRTIRKAGTSRYLGRRPRTRPSSMNPVDHPMGGRTRGGCQPCNVKGLITLNRSTVKKHHSNILYTKRQLKLLRQ